MTKSSISSKKVVGMNSFSVVYGLRGAPNHLRDPLQFDWTAFFNNELWCERTTTEKISQPNKNG